MEDEKEASVPACITEGKGKTVVLGNMVVQKLCNSNSLDRERKESKI